MNFWMPLLFIGELLVLFSGFLNFYLRIKAVEPVHWLLEIVAFQFPQKLACGIVLVVFSLTFLLFRKVGKDFMYALIYGGKTLFLLVICLLLPLNFLNIFLFISVITWTVWRIFNRCNIQIPEGERYARICLIAIVPAAAAGCWWGTWMQFDAASKLRLVFSDWSVYAMAYQKLGGCLFSAPEAFFNVGGHFNLLPNLIGALVFKISPEPFTIFFLNSFVIYSSVLCAFFVLRSCRIAPLHALVFSLALLGHFTLANLNLCVFYGYHPNIYFIPLFLLGFGFFQRKKYKLAAVFMILTLFVQETFAVFWFGIGLMYACFERGKKQNAGFLLMVLMVFWFWLVSRIFMSLGNAANAENYQQMFHYSNLGRNIPEILLSPLQKPGIFFRELLGIENFYFAGMLLAGSCAAFFAPKYLLALLPVFAGVALLNGSELSNVAMQYQVEMFALLTAASASGLAACRKISLQKGTALLAAAVTGAVLCGFFAGRLPWGLYGYWLGNSFPDRRDSIREFKKYIPAGKTLQTTLGFQAHFVGRNKLLDFTDKKILPEAEYVLIPRRDYLHDDQELENLLQQLLAEKKHKLLLYDNTPGAETLLLRREKR